jgi:predicted transcriptional regulator
MVHTDGMVATKAVVRQSVSLPSDVAKQVKSLAKHRRLSSNRMLVELVEDGLEAQRRKQEEFFALAERFRSASDPKEVARLGDELGRMVFGG